MENVVSFVFSFAIIIAVIAIVSNVTSLMFYRVVQAEKRSLDRFGGDMMVFYRTDGQLLPTKLLYITEENGTLRVTNGGASDVFSLRMLCWKMSEPVESLTLIHGKEGNLQPAAIEVLTYTPPINTVEYNLIAHGFDMSDLNETVCILAGSGFIREFVVHG